jgi:hypothetical protein
VIGYWGRIRRSRFLKERGHLAHLFNSGRAMRPRGADSFRKDLPQSRKGRQGTQRGKVIGYEKLVIGGAQEEAAFS